MTQRAIGTSWLIQPARNPNDDAAWNQTIGQMGLDELKPFMCPKSGGSVTVCMDCAGFRTCKVGQRAVRLTDEATKAKYVQKWTDEERVTSNPTSIERDEFKRACESGNAWYWLMEHKGLSKDAAKEQLTRMIKRYPGLAAEYGGGRRIMQRPRVVKITDALTEADTKAPAEPRMDQEQAPAAEAEQKDIPEAKAPEQAENRQRQENDYNRRMMEKAREQFRKAIESGDPVQFLMEDEGVSEAIARNRIKKWVEKYPDLCDGFVLERKKRGRKKKEPEVTEAAELAKPEAAENDDEVSLEEFLTEYQFNEAEADRKEEELQAEEFAVPASTIVNAVNQPQEPQKEPVTGDPMLDGMRAKLDELEAEKGRLRARIERIEAQQDAIRKCMAAFQ